MSVNVGHVVYHAVKVTLSSASLWSNSSKIQNIRWDGGVLRANYHAISIAGGAASYRDFALHDISVNNLVCNVGCASSRVVSSSIPVSMNDVLISDSAIGLGIAMDSALSGTWPVCALSISMML